MIATDALNEYKKATGAVVDDATTLLRITSSQYSNLESLFFNIAGVRLSWVTLNRMYSHIAFLQVSYELTANAQIWPRLLNTQIGGTASGIYLVVNDLGSRSGEGLDFTLGYAFLERFYSVFDTGNQRVGFATTPYTDATTN